ncbi:hypothetical protein D3C79_700950 [compost metagenome]
MVVFFRRFDHVIVNFEYSPCAGILLDFSDFLDALGGIAQLQDHSVRLFPLCRNGLGYLVTDPPLNPAGLLQLRERLNDPIMPDRGRIEWQCQNRRHRACDKRVPASAQSRLKPEAPLPEAQVLVVRRIIGDTGQPAPVKGLLVSSVLACYARRHPGHSRKWRPDHEITCFTHPQTEICIEPALLQRVRIQTLQLIEQLPPNQQAIQAQRTPALH